LKEKSSVGAEAALFAEEKLKSNVISSVPEASACSGGGGDSWEPGKSRPPDDGKSPDTEEGAGGLSASSLLILSDTGKTVLHFLHFSLLAFDNCASVTRYRVEHIGHTITAIIHTFDDLSNGTCLPAKAHPERICS
jgi:hypothetical protein